MHQEKKSSYDKISRNTVLTVISVSLAPLIVVGGLIFDQFRSIYREKVYSHLAQVVDKHRDNIDEFLQQKQFELQYLNRAYSYEQLTDPEFINEILRGMQQQYGRIFVDIGVIDETGKQIAYSGPFNLLGADYSEADWYQRSRTRQTGISDVFLGIRQSPHFIITINNIAEGHQWTLRATIDFLEFSHLVENIRIGETGTAYIINNNGVYQTRPRDSRLHNLVLTPEKDISQAEVLEGVNIQEASGDDGETYLMVSSPLNEGEWELIYQQNVGDAFSEMNRTEITTIVVFMFGGLAICIMAVIISRKLVVSFQYVDRESELMNRQMVETGKLAAIGELAAGIAHEINNPVAIMIEEAGWVSDLLEDEDVEMKSSDEIKRALSQVATQGRRCKDITHKLLSFARQTDSRVADISLPPLIEEVVNISMQQARYAQVDFNLDMQQGMRLISASVTELQQVFLNLVNNSIQAMEAEGGTLSIACREEEDNALVIVSDTGPGIPAANLNRVFDPFFTTKPVGKGSGLGLSICFGIIHQMGGEIDVESTVGIGTRFLIRLPFQDIRENQEQTKEIHHD